MVPVAELISEGARSRRTGAGMVTAEAAAVLPVVTAFALVLVWMVSLGIAQVRVVDAARDAARSVARGDDDATATAAARRTVGDDATVEIERAGALLTVTVTEVAGAPGWLLVPLPSVTLHASSTAEDEDAPAAR